jgi:hypothetical protein
MATDHPETNNEIDNEYDVVPAQGQAIHVDRGDVFENKLIDLSTGDSIHLRVTGANSVVRNVGFTGRYGGDKFLLSVDAGPGSVLVEDVYMGDGASKDGAASVHGPGGVFLGRGNEADVTFRRCNVQGFPSNGFHCSNTASGRGSVHFDSCFGKNNGVATFRCAGDDDLLENCVAYTDSTDYGDGDDDYLETNGRPVWVWNGGTVTIRDSHFGDGTYPNAIVAGANDSPGRIDFESGGYRGTIQRTAGSTVDVGSEVSTDPDLSVPAGVPTSPNEAAAPNDLLRPSSSGPLGHHDPLPHAIVFEGGEADEPSSYDFNTTSAVAPNRDPPINGDEIGTEQPVRGIVDDTPATYWFDGDVESLSVRGDATVSIHYDVSDREKSRSRFKS